MIRRGALPEHAPLHQDFLSRLRIVRKGGSVRSARAAGLLAGKGFMVEVLDVFGTFKVLPHFIALAVAYALAFPVGWDREKEERSAGLRTFPLVAVASCGFIQATEQFTQGDADAMARIIEGLITGMGFIGGGAILRLKDSVKGTATAASLWATGAVGVSVGLGAYDVAVVVSAMTFLTLRLLKPLKQQANALEDEEPRRRSS